MAKPKGPGGRRGGGNRATGTPAVQTVAAEPAAPKAPRVSPGQFIGQVRAEARKITWPSRKETWITSVMVFIMVVIAAIFFWIVDMGLSAVFQQIIRIGR